MTSPQTDGLFERSPRNPILTAEDLPYPANAIFNPGAAQVEGVLLDGLTPAQFFLRRREQEPEDVWVIRFRVVGN